MKVISAAQSLSRERSDFEKVDGSVPSAPRASNGGTLRTAYGALLNISEKNCRLGIDFIIAFERFLSLSVIIASSCEEIRTIDKSRLPY